MNPFYILNRSRLAGELKQLAKENAALGKPLSVLDDAVFKAMLTTDSDDSREALRSLLSACTRREVSAVKVINNDLVPAHLDAKSVRLDVHVTFNDGEVADLEMQVGKSSDDLTARAVFYAAMLFSAQLRKGKPYKDIKRVYQVFFLNCILFPQSDKLPRRYQFLEETEHDRLTDTVEIIFYELPKLEQRLQDAMNKKTKISSLPEDEKWCIFMRYRHDERAKSLIKKLCREDTGIMHAEKTLTKVSRDYKKYARKMAILKNSMDRASDIYNARLEGKEEGLIQGKSEGIAENNLDIARKMKAMGDSTDKIHTVTGIPAEIIDKM
ncbi:MAG: Rpn family recombination-promoting nuclease/putative transposase [Treponema sp.]|nr:Rpn family recombination-promoting nuclease/putative transposase [Treponema sp.]